MNKKNCSEFPWFVIVVINIRRGVFEQNYYNPVGLLGLGPLHVDRCINILPELTYFKDLRVIVIVYWSDYPDEVI